MTTWIVVGAGAAGCVVAGRLAEHGAHHVTLLEAGAGSTPAAIRANSFFDALALPGRTFPGPFQRGRGLGGSGAVNGMIATMGDPGQYRVWGWTDAPEAFTRIRVPVEPAALNELGILDRALQTAAPDAERVPLTRRDRRRVTPADAYLTAASAERLTLRTDASVVALVLDGRRAVGVRLAAGDVVEADRIMVTAGAIGSPALLLRSGIDTPLIGAGLRNHPGLPVVLHLRDGVEAPTEGLVTATALRRGVVQVQPLNHLGPQAPGLAMLLVVVMAPTGVGRVTVNAQAGDAEGIAVQQVLSPADRARLARGAVDVQRLLEHPALTALVDGVEIGEAPAGIFHPTSTCAMGRVVEADGAVRGYERLHVADASVFPDIPSTNTYLPTLMLAERLAARLAQLRD
ncbi:MAG: GMC family oxidoreductase N-terminal domain-containing protein [Actinomycetota bacterium]|nr:GMC family oxidoreductase N-terminal domain-containing protein [Acidimicrobiia bacterium]MDQ3469309.1 GMC family oxidoreductase N-terminal domain-containing protein [Actinomycetota bacterium]